MKKILLSIAMATLVAACGSQEVKKDVPVADRTARHARSRRSPSTDVDHDADDAAGDHGQPAHRPEEHPLEAQRLLRLRLQRREGRVRGLVAGAREVHGRQEGLEDPRRGQLRRARQPRVQPRPRPAPRGSGEEGDDGARRAGRPHRDGELRRGEAGRRRATTRPPGPRTAAATSSMRASSIRIAAAAVLLAVAGGRPRRPLRRRRGEEAHRGDPRRAGRRPPARPPSASAASRRACATSAWSTCCARSRRSTRRSRSCAASSRCSANQNEQIQKRQRDFYLDLDSRLKRLEGGGRRPGALRPARPRRPQRPSSPRPHAAPAPSKEEQAREVKAYDAASGLFRRNDFASAAEAFRAFLKDYPQSALAPNATYWIGICQANLKDYKGALATQEGLLARYPQSPKAPDALLAIAAVQSEQGDHGLRAQHARGHHRALPRLRGGGQGAHAPGRGEALAPRRRGQGRRPRLRGARFRHGARHGASRGLDVPRAFRGLRAAAPLRSSMPPPWWPARWVPSSTASCAWTSGVFGGSALTDRAIAVPTSPTAGIPVTYVPARNTVLLSLALAYAEVVERRRDLHRRQRRGLLRLPRLPPRVPRRLRGAWPTSPRSGPWRARPIVVRSPIVQLGKAEIVRRGPRARRRLRAHGLVLRRRRRGPGLRAVRLVPAAPRGVRRRRAPGPDPLPPGRRAIADSPCGYRPTPHRRDGPPGGHSQ